MIADYRRSNKYAGSASPILANTTLLGRCKIAARDLGMWTAERSSDAQTEVSNWLKVPAKVGDVRKSTKQSLRCYKYV